MNWAAFPYVRIAILFIAGIVTGEIWDFNLICVVICTAVSAVFYILSSLFYFVKKLWVSGLQSLILIAFVFTTGMTTVCFKKHHLVSEISTNELNRELCLTGIIDEPPVMRNRLRCMLKISNITTPEYGSRKVNFKMIVYFKETDNIAHNYKEGDLIHFKSKIIPIVKGTNPHAFDFGAYLRYRSVIHQTVVQPTQHKLIKSEAFFWYRSVAAKLRQQCLNILNKYIDSDRELAVAQAVLLGYRNLISDELYQDFTDSGAVHVLAVSGLHVAIVISVFIFLFDKIKNDSIAARIFKIMTLSGIVWLYVFMTGASPAVMRAGLMVTIFLIGKYTRGSTNIYNILAISAILLLLTDPFLLFQASFQFSYLALASIVYFQPHIQIIFVPKSKILQYSWNLISVAISAQILVFPVTVYYFHKFPVYFMLTGLVAIPLVLIVLYSGLLLMLVEFILPSLNMILAPLLKILLQVFVKTIGSIRDLPFSSIKEIWVDDFSLVLLYGAIFGTMIFVFNGKKKVFFFSLSVLFIFFIYSSIIRIQQSNQRKVIFYDVFGGVLVDYFDGTNCYFIRSGKVDDKAINFAASNNRMKHGIKYTTEVSNLAYFNFGEFEKYRNVVRLGQHKTLFINKSETIKNNAAEFEIICPLDNNFLYSLDEALIHKSKMYIFSRSIKSRYKTKVKDIIDENQTSVHDIDQFGAYQLNLH